MLFFNQLTAVLLSAALLGPMAPLEAKTSKGDKFLGQGRMHEEKKEWDDALENYEKALSEDPADLVYQMAAEKARFQAAQAHIDQGLKVRGQGQLGEALLEFQKAYGMNPGSSAAVQEIGRTQEMIQRERQRLEATGREAPPEERALTPVEEMKNKEQEKIERMLPVPELKPLNPQKIDLKMNGQKAKVIFETLGKVAGINVLWDPEYQAAAARQLHHRFRRLHHQPGAGLRRPSSPSPTGSRSRPTPSSSPTTTPTSAAIMKSRSARSST